MAKRAKDPTAESVPITKAADTKAKAKARKKAPPPATPVGNLEKFLSDLPPDTPPELLDLIATTTTKAAAGLPPGVFLETVEHLPLAISITDAKATILYVNSAFAKVSGYTPEELVGRNQSMNSADSTPRSVYQRLWATINAGEVWSGSLVNRRKNGTRYLVDLTIVPIRNAAGENRFFVGMHRDISDVHRLEQEISNQKALIESVIQAAPDAMAVLDPNRKVLIDNHAYKLLMGDFPGQEPALRILEAVAEIQGGSVDRIFSERNDFAHIEVRVDSLGGRDPKWMSCSGNWFNVVDSEVDSFFRKTTETGLLLVCNDITQERRRYEQARTAMVRALLADQERVDSVRETIAAAIFQLQVPINMVGAAVNVLERQGQGESVLASALKEAMGAGDQALTRLRNAMPSRIVEGVEPINLNEVVRDVLDVSFDRFLQAGAVVNWQPTSVLPKVPGRAGAVRAAVKHIVENAIDALGESKSADRDITVCTGVASDGLVEVSVRDSGPGLTDEARLKVFEPFYCGWRRRRGHSGMGLTMAQQVLSDQGGGIRIESRSGDAASGGGCMVIATFATRVPGTDRH